MIFQINILNKHVNYRKPIIQVADFQMQDWSDDKDHSLSAQAPAYWPCQAQDQEKTHVLKSWA